MTCSEEEEDANRAYNSSLKCGAYGLKHNANGSKHSLGFVSHFVAALVNSIIAAMATLNDNVSVASVTLAIILFVSRSCSSVAFSFVMALSFSNNRYARDKKR